MAVFGDLRLRDETRTPSLLGEEDRGMSDPDIALMAHLMRRAGWGVGRDELEERVARGYEATVEELIDPDRLNIPKIDPEILWRYHPELEIPGPPPIGRSTVIYYMITSKRPLEEKMALFWHQIFATGNSKVDSPPEIVRQIDMFRRCGLGNYRDLLVELAKDPAMIYWLDNHENHKDQPNENWGRELLELFTMGVGNYTEQDVYECSRAFTGWTVTHKLPRLPLTRYYWNFEFRPEDHDDTEKVFLDQRGRFNGEDIIDIIVHQPATARFIPRHLYNFFVADEPQVATWRLTPPRDPAAVNIIGDAFIESGYDIRSTLRVLFNSDFFKSEAVRWAKVKSPTEVVVGTIRFVGDFQWPKPGLLPIGEEPGYQGQELINPPSVEGWHTGAEWVDSGSLVRRINFAADRLSNIDMPGVQSIIGRIKERGNISPEDFVASCLDLIGPLDVSDQTHQELTSLAEQAGELQWDTEGSASTSAQRVGDMLALIAASTEYQFA